MASIRKRGKNWEAQVRVRGWDPLTRAFPTKADALQWSSEREAEMRRGTFVDTTSLRDITLRELLQRHLAEVTPRHKGSEAEGYRLRAMMRLPMAGLTLDRVSPAVICEWRDARLMSVSGDTVRREMNLLCGLFTHAKCEWHLPLTNPVKGLKRPSAGASRSRRPSWSELKKLLRQLTPRVRDDGYWVGARNPWVRPAVLLALRTAMRRGELLSARWEWVDFAGRCIHLSDSKNGEARDVPLSRKAMLVLKRIGPHKAGLVFPTTLSAFKQALADAMDRSGVEDLRLHDFRHDATTRIAEKLSNVLELAAVTGHKSLDQLKRYYNPKASHLAEKLDATPG